MTNTLVSEGPSTGQAPATEPQGQITKRVETSSTTQGEKPPITGEIAQVLRELDDTVRRVVEEDRGAPFIDAPSVPRLTARRVLLHPLASIKQLRDVKARRVISV
jgi:hypothetical protein